MLIRICYNFIDKNQIFNVGNPEIVVNQDSRWIFFRFYTDGGSLIYTSMVPSDSSPVSAVTWGHNDKRLFVATGNQVRV